MTVTTQTNKITEISETSVSSASTNSVTFTGAAAGDLIGWTTDSDCSGVVPATDPADDTTITGVGTYILCLRENGASDSVQQAGISMLVTTQTNKITEISQTSVSSASSNSVTFTGAASDDLIAWTTGDCTVLVPA